jgi:hypothetical protein
MRAQDGDLSKLTPEKKVWELNMFVDFDLAIGMNRLEVDEWSDILNQRDRVNVPVVLFDRILSWRYVMLCLFELVCLTLSFHSERTAEVPPTSRI